MIDPVVLFVLIFVWLIPSLVLVPTVVRLRRGGWTWIIWTLVSLVCSPLLTLIALAAIPHSTRSHEDDDRLPCQFCGEDVRVTAIICPHCRSDLQKGDVERLRPR